MSRVVCLITNIPAPYRIPVFDRLYSKLREQNIDLIVLYLSRTEPNRLWKLPDIWHKHEILPGRVISVGGVYFHWNPSLIKQLNLLKPIAVITCGFDFAMMQGFLWSVLKRVPHISFSDGTLDSESNIGFFRRLTRKIVIKNSHSLVGASLKTLSLFQHYGAARKDCFQSCLCVDNSVYIDRTQKKAFDLLYVARIVRGKMPELIIEIMEALGGDYSLEIVGDGNLRGWFIDTLAQKKVKYNYDGFVQPEFIPRFYQSSSLLLFPTRSDSWGVVANEACAAGVPVLTTESAGVAGELIVHGENGFVLPPLAHVWADHIRLLLSDQKLYQQMSRNAFNSVQSYNYESASSGLLQAVLNTVNGSC